jgi:hypothetical protein
MHITVMFVASVFFDMIITVELLALVSPTKIANLSFWRFSMPFSLALRMGHVDLLRSPVDRKSVV